MPRRPGQLHRSQLQPRPGHQPLVLPGQKFCPVPPTGKTPSTEAHLCTSSWIQGVCTCRKPARTGQHPALLGDNPRKANRRPSSLYLFPPWSEKLFFTVKIFNNLDKVKMVQTFRNNPHGDIRIRGADEFRGSSSQMKAKPETAAKSGVSPEPSMF